MFRLLPLLLLLPLSASSQLLPYPTIYDDWASRDTGVVVEAELYGLGGADYFNNDLLNNYFFQDHLSEETVESAMLEAGDENWLGQDVNGFVGFTNKRSEGLNWGMSLFTDYYTGVEASHDALALVLEGNSDYKGETLLLDNLHYSNTAYAGMKVHLMQERQWDKTKVTFGGAFGILATFDFQEARIFSGSLYTSPFADSLHATLDMELLRNGQNRNNNLTGYGAVVDLFVNVAPSERLGISAVLQDAGFLNYSSRTELYEVDTSFSFTGVELNELIQDTNDLSFSIDNLLEDYSTTTTGNFSQSSPFLVKVNAYYELIAWKGRVDVGVAYRHATAFRPLVYGIFSRDFGDQFFAQAGLNYGGYGHLGVTLGGGAEFGRWEAGLALHNLNGLLLPGSFGGHSAQVSLSTRF